MICNPQQLDAQGCNSAPDWIIEIVSKNTAKHDTQTKFHLYQECGVQEYWLIYPDLQIIQQFVLDDHEHYQLLHCFAEDDQAVAQLFPDLSIAVTDIFSGWN